MSLRIGVSNDSTALELLARCCLRVRVRKIQFPGVLIVVEQHSYALPSRSAMIALGRDQAPTRLWKFLVLCFLIHPLTC